jgi:hypothetical protein
MTALLEKVFEEVSKLPESEQDEIASIILEEIISERRWDEAFAKSQDKLSKLADEALEEFEFGRTKKMGFDEL